MKDFIEEYIADVITEEIFLDKIKEYCHNVNKNRTSVSMKGVNGAPAWYGYEHDIWTLGEELRHAMKQKKNLKRSECFFSLINYIISNKNFGKGRQSFVMLLESIKMVEENIVRQLIFDPEIQGHLIKALIKAENCNFIKDIEKICEESKPGWIKQAAKKYIQKFSDDTTKP